MKAGPKPRTFDVLARGDGQYDVIFADTGRPAAAPRPSRRSANGLAYQMNTAAAAGPRALARVLGCGRR